MIYNHENAFGATVEDVDRKRLIEQVSQVDTDKCEVTYYNLPIQIERGEVLQTTVQFERIIPVLDKFDRPSHFNCYRT